MELFPDGAHVRLRIRRNDNVALYLYAHEDGVDVYPSLHRASLNAAWAVHRVDTGDRTFFLLRGAAYGLYLGMTTRGAPQGYAAPAQCSYGSLQDHRSLRKHGVMWEAFDAGNGAGDVVLHNRRHGRWTIRWIVQAIPSREDPPELPDVAPPPRVPVGPMARRAWAPPLLQRTIRYLRGDEFGWRRLRFEGRSVSQLRAEIAAALDEANAQNITLCVKAGLRGRLTPLVIDLPNNQRSMDIVVFTTGSEDAQMLVYPDVDAP